MSFLNVVDNAFILPQGRVLCEHRCVCVRRSRINSPSGRNLLWTNCAGIQVKKGARGASIVTQSLRLTYRFQRSHVSFCEWLVLARSRNRCSKSNTPPPPQSKLWLLIIVRWQVYRLPRLVSTVVRFQRRGTH